MTKININGIIKKLDAAREEVGPNFFIYGKKRMAAITSTEVYRQFYYVVGPAAVHDAIREAHTNQEPMGYEYLTYRAMHILASKTALVKVLKAHPELEGGRVVMVIECWDAAGLNHDSRRDALVGIERIE